MEKYQPEFTPEFIDWLERYTQLVFLVRGDVREIAEQVNDLDEALRIEEGFAKTKQAVTP